MKIKYKWTALGSFISLLKIKLKQRYIVKYLLFPFACEMRKMTKFCRGVFCMSDFAKWLTATCYNRDEYAKTEISWQTRALENWSWGKKLGSI